MTPRIQSLPPAHAQILETVQHLFGAEVNKVEVQPLTGDASNRAYYRLSLSRSDGTQPDSVVLMQLADPEGFKASEEAVSGCTVPVTELPFINILRFLASVDLPVPRLYHYDRDAGLLFLEDFGDETLTRAAVAAPAPKVRGLYEQAVDLLAAMQSRAGAVLPRSYQPTGSDRTCLAFGRRFEVPLLLWEFDHFLEFGVEARAGRTMQPEDRQAVRQSFQRMAESLAGLPQVFTHRDYHSRNLMMIKPTQADGQPRFGLLDFQDALIGPITYDLASLLRDSYLELDDVLVEDLLERYRLQILEWSLGHIEQDLLTGKDAFRYAFDLTCLQRNLKAIGRFVYIDRVKHNPAFLQDIPRTFSYVKRNLLAHPELDSLRERLGRYVPELA